jgi:hypothetical protein
VIYTSYNNGKHPLLRPSLHLSTFRFFPFKLPPTILHFPLIWLNPIQFSYRSISPHITTLHPTSHFFTFRRFLPHFYSFRFTLFIIDFLTLFLKFFCLQWEVPNTSRGSWFQFLITLFTKEYFPISILCFMSLIYRTFSTLLK